jgi:hypothetical protein
MELSAGNERDEVCIHLAGVVAADEEPVLAADGLAAKLALREVVVDGQAAVVEEAREREPLSKPGSDLANTQQIVGTAIDCLEPGPRPGAFRTDSENGRRIGPNQDHGRRSPEVPMSKGNERLRAGTRRGEGLGTDYESEGRRFESHWAHLFEWLPLVRGEATTGAYRYFGVSSTIAPPSGKSVTQKRLVALTARLFEGSAARILNPPPSCWHETSALVRIPLFAKEPSPAR